jgi:hypothetical protein
MVETIVGQGKLELEDENFRMIEELVEEAGSIQFHVAFKKRRLDHHKE